jgi:Peptidase family M48
MQKNFIANLVFFFMLPLTCISQSDFSFKPLRTKPDNSTEIKITLRKAMLAELNTMPENIRIVVRESYEKSLDQLNKVIDNRGFIWSDTLTAFVEIVMNRIIRQNNLRHIVPVVLIANSPEANAYCLGNGTIVITIGLLARITTEDQLAFVLSHELEHHQLYHVRTKIFNEEQSGSMLKLKSTVKDILRGGEPISDIEKLRESFYQAAQFSQQYELDADSGAIWLLQNTHYLETAGLEALDLLELGYCVDSVNSHKLFKPLDSPRFPFQYQWIERDFKTEGTERTTVLFFNTDSLRSHPISESRKETMVKRLELSEDPYRVVKSIKVDSINRIAAFQNVKSAFDLRMLDVSLYLVLNLMQHYERNDFLVEHLGRLLVVTAELKQQPELRSQFYKPTYNYCDGLRSVSNLLRSISAEQVGEMLFQFMNSSKHFNSENEFHYYLMWKSCELTAREATGRNVRDKYLKKFPRGEFKSSMK